MPYDPFDAQERGDGREMFAATEAALRSAKLAILRERREAIGAAADLPALSARTQAALDVAYDLFRFEARWLEGGRREARRAWDKRRAEVQAAFAARLGELEAARRILEGGGP